MARRVHTMERVLAGLFIVQLIAMLAVTRMVMLGWEVPEVWAAMPAALLAGSIVAGIGLAVRLRWVARRRDRWSARGGACAAGTTAAASGSKRSARSAGRGGGRFGRC